MTTKLSLIICLIHLMLLLSCSFFPNVGNLWYFVLCHNLVSSCFNLQLVSSSLAASCNSVSSVFYLWTGSDMSKNLMHTCSVGVPYSAREMFFLECDVNINSRAELIKVRSQLGSSCYPWMLLILSWNKGHPLLQFVRSKDKNPAELHKRLF